MFLIYVVNYCKSILLLLRSVSVRKIFNQLCFLFYLCVSKFHAGEQKSQKQNNFAARFFKVRYYLFLLSSLVRFVYYSAFFNLVIQVSDVCNVLTPHNITDEFLHHPPSHLAFCVIAVCPSQNKQASSLVQIRNCKQVHSNRTAKLKIEIEFPSNFC